MFENEKTKDQPKEPRAEKADRTSEPARVQPQGGDSRTPPKFRENSLPVAALMEREKLSPMLKGALMAAYSWKPDTALAPSEFKRKVETWLKQPAAERGAK